MSGYTIGSCLAAFLFAGIGVAYDGPPKADAKPATIVALHTPGVTCISRYKEAVAEHLKEADGLRVEKVEFLPHAPEHGPVSAMGGQTAKVTVRLAKAAKASALAKAIQNLGVTVVE